MTPRFLPRLAAAVALGAGLLCSAPAQAGRPIVSPRDPEGIGLTALGAVLVAGGLVGGAVGFGILYGCREGESCHGDATTALGWVLAAPGIPPLTVGIVLIAMGLHSDNVARAAPVHVVAESVPGGGTLGVAVDF
jgi:hypothetical protein